eukprot:4013996-Alexandrium_andersonii.AAC.1
MVEAVGAVPRPERPKLTNLLASLADRAGDLRVRAVNLPTQELVKEDPRGVRASCARAHRDVR